jgi:uncharacterized protein (TIGR03118 family)
LAPPATNFAAIPPGAGLGVGPTGQVSNPAAAINPAGASFDITPGNPAFFIFTNLNGTISAWNPMNANGPTHNAATVVATATAPNSVYTGLAMNSAGNLLYAANGTTGAIDEFNGSFKQQTTSGFVDPTLPAGFVPFNVEDMGGTVYVTYAPAGHAAQVAATARMGWVATFKEDGALIQNLVMGGPLASPWGMAIAPAGFGSFGGDLLVGNFAAPSGVSEINIFNATTGMFVDTFDVNSGPGNTAGGLWDLTFGGGALAGDPDTLFFTDGINGEKDGLFGALTVPEPSTWAMMLMGLAGVGFAAYRRARKDRLAPTLI